jgi:flagellar export protein FliJ
VKKYRFRLATLRKLRVLRRDELRGKLAEAHRAVQLLEDQTTAVAEELEQLLVTQRNAVDGALTDVTKLLEAGRYQSALRAQQATMKEQLQLLATEVERRRQAVVEADQQVRILDKLEERQLAERQQELQRREIKEFDDIASQRTEVEPAWLL